MDSDNPSEEVLVLFKALTNTDHGLPERHLTLTKDASIIPIGRSSKRRAELEPSRTNAFFDCPVMSREHAELHLDSEKRAITIQDTGSLHGTLLNKVALRPTETRILNTGDIISFGLAINRGADEFTPHQVEANITWKSRRLHKNVGTYRVPDDTDIEELSDNDDGIPKMSFARKVIHENKYHPVDYKENHIDLTNSRLPPISSFDTPSNAITMVDLTSDEPSSGGHFGSSFLGCPIPSDATSLPTTVENGAPPHDHRQPNSEIAMWELSEEENDDSYASSDDLEDSDDLNMESSEEEDGADFNLSQAEISGEEAEDLWGIEEEDLASLDVDDVVSAMNKSVDNPDPSLPTEQSQEPSQFQYTLFPTAFDTTGPVVMNKQPAEQPSFAPADLEFKPDIQTTPSSHHFEGGKLAFNTNKEDFFKAREENRRTLGLPKATPVQSGNQLEAIPRSDDSDDIVLNNGPDVDHSNDLLRTGGDFLNEPIKDVKINESATMVEEPVLDESSAYQFQMSKKAATQAADTTVAFSTEFCTNIGEPNKATPKRKADDISESTPEEEVAVITKPTQDKETVISSAGVTQPVFSLASQASGPISGGPIERPAKRFRRAVEAVGYAAIGGIAVMSALIATAPQL